MKLDSNEGTNNIQPNAYYCPEIIKHIMNTLFARLPLTTAIMCAKYGNYKARVNNSDIEKFHSTVKRQFMAENSLPTFLDIFLLTYYQNLDGMLKLKVCNVQTSNNEHANVNENTRLDNTTVPENIKLNECFPSENATAKVSIAFNNRQTNQQEAEKCHF